MGAEIKSLGAAISNELEALEQKEPTLASNNYDPYVPIQTGSRASEISIFCIPGAGDSAFQFERLAAEFGERYSLHGLQARGLDGSTEPHSTVEAAARAYLPTILEADDRRIHLIGHSFGGWIAFEIAQQLIGDGKEVASLTLIDTGPPSKTTSPAPEVTTVEAFREWLRMIELAAEQELFSGETWLKQTDEVARLELVHRKMVAKRLLPERSRAEMLRGSLNLFGSALRTSYVPRRPYLGRVRLVLTVDQQYTAAQNQQRHRDTFKDWTSWAPRIERWIARGNHVTVLKHPSVKELATWWLAAEERLSSL